MSKRIVVLAVLIIVSCAAPASAATKRCGDAKPWGITNVRAESVGCATALKVARNHNYGTRTKGWSCKDRRLSSRFERVTCRRGVRRVTFRSTYQMELPAAPAPPSAGAG